MPKVLRLLPVLIAFYELRYALASVGAATLGPHHGPFHLLALGTVSLGVAWLLLQAGRGLPGLTGRPRWSAAFARRWLRCGAALLVFLGCLTLASAPLGAGHHAVLAMLWGPGSWSSIGAAVAVGFVLAASLGGGRWVLRAVARLRRHGVALPRLGLATHRAATAVFAAAPAAVPLSAGWSDRGPPRTARSAF